MKIIYSPYQVFAGAFFGGPIAAVYLVWKNFEALGKESLARTCAREIKEELDIEIEVGKRRMVIRHAYSHYTVRLSVFDLLGREVSALVNEKREAGYHSVDFNASNLSSGVYFYRLQAGEFVQTRKLLLIR